MKRDDTARLWILVVIVLLGILLLSIVSQVLSPQFAARVFTGF